MRKTIFILCTAVAISSLTAFGGKNWQEPEIIPTDNLCKKTVKVDYGILSSFDQKTEREFAFKVASRFNATITKEKLTSAKSILSILPEKETLGKEDIRNVEVAVHRTSGNISEKGNNHELTANQLDLLQSADYSTTFNIGAFCNNLNSESGKFETYEIVYYFSIVPEKEAEYVHGPQALIHYLKTASEKEVTGIDVSKLQPGRVYFTVTKEGSISKVQLEASSGCSSLDKKMLELISNQPGEWSPAKNSKGEHVDQELVFFFGQEGC